MEKDRAGDGGAPPLALGVCSAKKEAPRYMCTLCAEARSTLWYARFGDVFVSCRPLGWVG